jgi:hypothetical protein
MFLTKSFTAFLSASYVRSFSIDFSDDEINFEFMIKFFTLIPSAVSKRIFAKFNPTCSRLELFVMGSISVPKVSEFTGHELTQSPQPVQVAESISISPALFCEMEFVGQTP